MSYKKNRAKLIEQMQIDYGYIYCQFCHKSNAYKFEVHHIFYRSEKPNHPNLHDLRNLIIVCSRCHKRLHDKKHLRDDLVRERKLKELFKIN